MAYKSNFLQSLTDFLKGKISGREFSHSEPTLYGVDEKTPIGDSILQFDLNHEDEEYFLKAIGLNEDDVYMINRIFGYYSSYDYHDPYSIREDFENGYFFQYYLDEDNIKQLEKIAEYVYPKEEFDLSDVGYMSRLGQTLEVLFPKEIDSLVDDVTSEKNEALGASLKDKINNELDSFFKNYRIDVTSKWNRFRIKAKDLLKMYYIVGSDEFSPLKVFKKYFDGSDWGLGGWSDDVYNYEDDSYMDWDSLHRDFSREFDRILEKIEEDDGKFKKLLEIRNRIFSKHSQNVWYNLPKSPKYLFIVRGVNPETFKVIVGLKESKGRSAIKKIELSEENYYHLLYQPSLFNFEEL